MTTVEFEGPVGINEAELLETGARDGYAHNIAFVHEIHGALDVPKLARAARWLSERHEGFRTSFVRTEAGWRRRVHAENVFALNVVDLTQADDPEARAREAVVALFRTPFDRAVPNLIRASLFLLGPTRYWFLSHCDHLALDGVGYAVCLTELLMGYATLLQGGELALPPAPQPREHFAAVNDALAKVRETPGPWSEPVAHDAFALHPDATRPGDRDPAGARIFTQLAETEAVDAMSRAQGVSRSAPILAAMAIALREVAARPDVTFSLIRSGRREPGTQGIAGCLAWGDAFSTQVDDDEPFAAVIQRADAFIRDGSPWRMLYIPTVNPPGRRIVLNVNRYDTGLSLPDLTVIPRPDVLRDVLMWEVQDLLVQVFPLPGMIHGVVRYRVSHFEPATMERLAEVLGAALRAMVADPAAPVRAVRA